MTRMHGFTTILGFLGLFVGEIRVSYADDLWAAFSTGPRNICLSNREGHGDTQTAPCPVGNNPMPVIRIPPVLVTPAREPSSPTRDEVLKFLRQLHHKILESHRYLLNARKLGLEGTVTVAFNLMPDGNAQAIRVLKTSGHPLLDEAALDAVQHALPFKPPLKAGSPPLELTVPISFTLR